MINFNKLTSTKLIVALIFTLLMIGCGDGSTTPSEPITYHLYDDGQFNPGYQISFSLTGRSSVGAFFTGTVSITATRDQALYAGEPVIPVETYMRLTETNSGNSTSTVSTEYFNPYNFEPVLMELEGVLYTPTDISVMPDTAEIGDFGELTTYSGIDGSTITGTWRLEDAGSGLADIVQQIYYSGGALDFNTTSKIRIDETGNPSGYSQEIYYPSSGVRVYLSGGRV